MIVLSVDIIISEPIQTACSWLKHCCVLYIFHRVLALSVLVLWQFAGDIMIHYNKYGLLQQKSQAAYSEQCLKNDRQNKYHYLLSSIPQKYIFKWSIIGSFQKKGVSMQAKNASNEPSLLPVQQVGK